MLLLTYLLTIIIATF